MKIIIYRDRTEGHGSDTMLELQLPDSLLHTAVFRVGNVCLDMVRDLLPQRSNPQVPIRPAREPEPKTKVVLTPETEKQLSWE